MSIRALLTLAASLLITSGIACSGGGSNSSEPAPAITSGSGASATTIILSDGQTQVGTVTATHPDPMETLAFMLDGGVDEASFAIDSATGVLDLSTAPDYANPTDADMDNVYEIRVAVTDSVGARDTQQISVVVAFNVDTLEDIVDGDFTAGDRSLREVIDYVFDGDAVSFAPALSGQTIVLEGGQIAIEKNLMIDGDLDNDGAADITIDADALSRIFALDDGSGTPDRDVRLSGLWLTNGMATGPGGAILNRENLAIFDCSLFANHTMGTDSTGGAISSGPGDLTIEDTNVFDNSATGRDADGGGIANIGGELKVTSSVVARNQTSSRGGGVFSDGGSLGPNGGSLTIRRTDIDANSAGSRGGGVSTRQETYAIEQSTIRYNDCGGDGGGIHSVTNNPTQSGTILNSTIHGNSTDEDGGGLFILFNRVRILNSTITSNQAGRRGGGIDAGEYDPDFDSRVELASTIVASNARADLDFETFFTGLNPYRSLGGNVIGIGNAIDRFGPSELIGTADPQLGNLDDFGGETPTRPPLATSPAIDAGVNPNRLRTDQRGEVRTFGGRTDAGAVERNDMD